MYNLKIINLKKTECVNSFNPCGWRRGWVGQAKVKKGLMTEQLQAAWTKSRHSLPKNRFYHQDLVSANKNRKRKYTAIFDRSIKSLINFIYIPNGTSCSENST